MGTLGRLKVRADKILRLLNKSTLGVFMHSISLYHLRAFNPDKVYSDGSRYAPLDDVNGKDLISIFKKYVESLNRKDFELFESEKSVMSFEKCNISSNGRCIWGIVNTGSYGIKGAIRDARTGEHRYDKSSGDADIKQRFYLLFSPSDKNEAVAVLHGINGDGIKTILSNSFGKLFKGETKLTLQFNPVTYEKAVRQWQKAQVKEIRAIGFKPYSDKTDFLKGLGHKQSELIIKPERNRAFGILENFRKGSRSEAIEFLENNCKDLKALVELDGKKRVFRIGGTRANPVFRLDLDESVSIVDGVPDFDEMYDWVVDVVNELSQRVYQGQKVSLCPAR